MNIDGTFLHLIARELEGELKGFRIDKIHMTSKTEFVFAFRTFDGVKKLFISASGQTPGLYITGMQADNPDKPPMLCMLFRKQLVGATLTGIDQAGLDRILFLRFSATNEIGDKVRRTLAVEIMAQYSNIILLDENDIVIDSVKRVDFSKSSARQVLPGMPYRLPPGQDKLNLLAADSQSEEWRAESQSEEWRVESGVEDSTKFTFFPGSKTQSSAGVNAGESEDENNSTLHSPLSTLIHAVTAQETRLSKAILNVTQGASPLLARELAYRVDPDDGAACDLTAGETERLTEEFENLKKLLETGEGLYPNAVTDAGGVPKDGYYMPLTQYGGMKTVVYPTLSALVYEFNREKETAARMKARAEDLFRVVNTHIERLSRKLNNQLAELEATKDREQKRIYGELIYANLHTLERGALFYDLPDYYSGGDMVRIPARPELGPAENAERYFKEYRKLKNAETILTKLINEGENELEYLKTVSDELSRAELERETGEIREELIRGGYLKRRGRPAPKKNQKPEFAEFVSPGGFRVAVGRNNLQNDELTHKTAGRRDIWFHVQKAPGSHVVLFTDGAAPGPEDMEFAASLAVRFSSKRGGSAEVDYTEVANLKKPGGARPGFVIYHVYNSMRSHG